MTTARKKRRIFTPEFKRQAVALCAAFRTELDKVGAVASMSRKGDCLDNAAMESFWRTLKTERVYQTECAMKDEARRD